MFPSTFPSTAIHCLGPTSAGLFPRFVLLTIIEFLAAAVVPSFFPLSDGVSLRVCVILATVDKRRSEMASVGGVRNASLTPNMRPLRIYKWTDALAEHNPQSQSQFWVLLLFNSRGCATFVRTWHRKDTRFRTKHALPRRRRRRQDAAHPFRAPASQRGEIRPIFVFFHLSCSSKTLLHETQPPCLPNREKNCQTSSNNAEIILLIVKKVWEN